MVIASAYASSVSIEVSIERDFNVVFQFTIDNATLYESLKATMNAVTVPDAILRDFFSKNKNSLLDALQYSEPSISFPTSNSIRSAFRLYGSGIINSTVDRVAMVETFRMNTAWREFNLTITGDFFYNFTQSLATSLAEWNESTVDGITSFTYSNPTAGVSCSFKLPAYATNAFAVGETIFFDAPYEPPWEDKLINSPILILIGLAIAGVVVFAYRKIR
jgi:hypothetical protein